MLHGCDSMSGLSLYRIVQCLMEDSRCVVPRSLRSLTIWLGFFGRLLRLSIQGHQTPAPEAPAFHPIVSTSTGWFALLGVVSGDVGKTRSPSCAPRTLKLAQAAFADASEFQRPNTFHMLRCNGVPRSSITRDLVTGGGRIFLREHFQHARRLLRRLLLVND